MSDWTDEEESAFINFIIAEANISSTPVAPYDFCEKMKQLTESARSSTYLYFKLNKFKANFNELNSFDMATKENVIRMLSIPDQLQKKQVASQSEVNEPDESEPTSLKKNLPDEPENPPIDRRMLKFLAEKTRSTFYMTDTSFLRDFGEQAGNIEIYSQLRERYRLLKKQIHLATEYDQPTRVKMLLLSKTEISDELLKDLRKTAAVAVDNKNRITEYAAFDGSVILSRAFRPTKYDPYLDIEEKMMTENTKSKNDVKEEEEDDDDDEEEDDDDDDDDDYEEPYRVNRTTRSGRVSRQNSKYGAVQTGKNCSKTTDEDQIVPKQEVDDEMEYFIDKDEGNTTTRSGRISRKRSTYDAGGIKKKSERKKSEKRCSTPPSSKRTRRYTEMSRTAKLAPSSPNVANRRMRVVDSEPEEVDSADETLVLNSDILQDFSETMSATESDEPVSQESAVELISAKDFLSSFRTMVLSLNARTLVALEEKIEDAVEQFNIEDHQIPIKKLRPILEATLEMIIP